MVVELTHVGSLYHDDVMDEAELRRGSDSANARWGNTVAILVGDLLFARASDTVAELGPEFVHLQARTFSRLVQGQIAETVGPTDGEDPLDHYLQVVADKTGSLIATSALFGAKLSGATADEQELMAEFGEQIGVVFQLSDDIIDITSDVTGKTPGTDLREGIPTLPTLLARKSTDPDDARLLELLDSDLHDDDALAEVLELLRRHCSIDQARGRGRPPRRSGPRPPRAPSRRRRPRRPRGPLQHGGHPLRLSAHLDPSVSCLAAPGRNLRTRRLACLYAGCNPRRGAATCVKRPSAGDDHPAADVEASGLFQRTSQLLHRPPGALRHDVRPDEAAHPAHPGPHRVLPTLLTEDAVRW